MFQEPQRLLNAETATGPGIAMLVADFDHVEIEVNTTNSANLTVKFAISNQLEKPDFSAAQSPTNRWDYVAVRDLEDKSTLDGDVGFAVAGSDDNRIFEAELNRARWFCPIITARVAGNITVHAAPYQVS